MALKETIRIVKCDLINELLDILLKQGVLIKKGAEYKKIKQDLEKNYQEKMKDKRERDRSYYQEN